MKSLYLIALFGFIEIYSQDWNMQIINSADEYSHNLLRQCVKHLYLPSHITRVLVPGYQEFTLVYKDITCRFRISMRERDGEHYKYRAGAYSGVHSEGEVKFTTRDCAIFPCAGDTIDTCGKRFNPKIENSTMFFDELHIEGTVLTSMMDPNIKAYNLSSSLNPSSLNMLLQPLEPNCYNFFVEEKEDKTTHNLSLNNTEVQLLIFALWGREFERPETSGEEESQGINEKGGEIDNLKDDDEKEETQEDNDEGKFL